MNKMREHYKLYKAGKLWLTACIVTLGMIGYSTAYADGQQPATNSQSSQQVTVTTQTTTNEQSNPQTTPVQSTSNNDDVAAAKNSTESTQANTSVDTAASNSQTANTEATSVPTNLNNGWNNNHGNWYYVNNGVTAKNWQRIDNDWYYFNPTSSVMQTGLQNIQNTTYYLNEQHDGRYGAMLTGWQKVNNNWYYFAQSGAAETNWQQINHNWYYFNTNGAAQTGWLQNNGHWYYFDNQNAWAETGWQSINNRWYYFDNQNTWALSGWYQSGAGNWYYFDPTNAWAETGWQKINNRWYYFDNQNAWALTGWRLLGEQWYYLNPSQTWMETGWQRIDNQWYYFDQDNGEMVSGVHQINDKTYYFQPNHNGNFGAMLALTGWQKINNQWYYFNDDNTLQTGWLKSNNRWYYFDPQSAAAETGHQQINGHQYNFDAQNAWALTGWQSQNDKRYYYDPTNAWMDTDWQRVGNEWYYFDTSDGHMFTGLWQIGGNIYYLNNQHDGHYGAMATGQREINNHWYNFGQNGAATHNAWADGHYYGQDYLRYQDRSLIQGENIYYFDQNGNLIRNQDKVVAGITIHFNSDGVGHNELLTNTQSLARQVAIALTNKFNSKNVKYDWTNQDHNYQELSLHDMAYLLAGNDVNNDPQIIEKLLVRDDLLNGKVISAKVYNLAQTSNQNDIINDFINGLPSGNYDNTVIGIGINDDKQQLAVILFNPGQTDNYQQSSSTIQPRVQNVYKAPGVKVDVDGGLAKGQAVDPVDVQAMLNTPGLSNLLKGEKGRLISSDVLKAIFAGLPGNADGLTGVKTYKNGNDNYHYVYWLEGGNSSDDKLQNFLDANKGAKYGDQLKVNYSATLTYGAGTPINSVDTDKTPASQKTANEISLAYQKGTESGAQYDTVTVQPIANMKQDTIRGVDVSSYQSLIDNGVQFYDFNGRPASLMKVLADSGVNYVRLRLWVDPYDANGGTYGGGNDDEFNVIKMAKEAESYGMKVLLCFHYSDFWADPSTQLLPKAWENLDNQDLNTELYLYNKKVINDFKNAGVTIDMAQLGNEITKGFLGLQDNYLGVNVWSNNDDATLLTGYLNSASKAFRESSPTTQLAVHIETPDVYNYNMIMGTLKENNVDYDILASSYYPVYGWWNNNPDNLAKVEKMVNDKYGKKFVVAEAGWPFTLQNSDGTPNNIGSDPGHYSISPQGQVDQMTAMYKTILSNPNGMGAFYWEPAWIPVKAGWDNWQYNHMMGDLAGTGWASINSRGYYPDSKIMYQEHSASGGSSWDNLALFDDHGHPLQSLKMYNGFLNGYQSPTIANNIENK